MDDRLFQDRLKSYQSRVTDWMSDQGLLFQLRHAGSIGGANVGRKLASLALSLVVAVLVLAGIGYAILLQYFKSSGYEKKLVNQVKAAVTAEKIDVSGFRRQGSSVSFKDIKLEGSESSFFETGKMKVVSAPLAFLTGLTEEWNPKAIKIREAEFEIKAGGDETMVQAFQGVVESLDGKGLEEIRIGSASFDWGYTVPTYGRVEDTKLDALLVDQKWEISLEGGTYQQNWLQGFQIVSAELILDDNGIQVTDLQLGFGDGTMKLSGAITGTRQLPEFDLSGTFTNLALEKLLPMPGVRVQSFLSGVVSGVIKVYGSPDRVIKTEGEIDLEPGNFITIRERWEVLRSLSVLDKNRSYRRIDFKEGRLQFRTEDGSLSLSDVNLRSREKEEVLVQLTGGLKTRLPSQEEAAAALKITLTDGFTGDSFGIDATDSSFAQALEDERISLKKAAGGGKKSVFGSQLDLMTLGSEGAGDRPSRAEIESERLKAEMKVYRIEGEMVLTLPEDAFELYPPLETHYPAGEDGRRAVSVPLKGSFSKATEEIAQELYNRSREEASPSDAVGSSAASGQ